MTGDTLMLIQAAVHISRPMIAYVLLHGAAIYKLMGKEITSSKSKEQAKSRMKKDYKEIEKSVDKLCLQQSSL
jgi:hypothetical protein